METGRVGEGHIKRFGQRRSVKRRAEVRGSLTDYSQDKHQRLTPDKTFFKTFTFYIPGHLLVGPLCCPLWSFTVMTTLVWILVPEH